MKKKNLVIPPAHSAGRSGRVLSFLKMNVGLLLMVISVYFFKIPNRFATGGVSGLAAIAAALFPAVTPAGFILGANLLLLALGFLFLGHSVGIKTVYCTLMFSAGTWLLERWLPYDNSVIFQVSGTLSSQPLLELVFEIMLASVGSAMLFWEGASSGGTDIIALIVQKYTKIPVGRAILVADFAVGFASFFIFNMETGLLSVAGLFAKAFLVDSVLESINLCKYFTIITEHPDEVERYILKTMRHGVTRCQGEGVYSGVPRTVLLTVCRRNEGLRFKEQVRQIDPDAFVIVTNTSEIVGRGFRSV